MANPVIQDVHLDVPLTNISTQYKNPKGNYVADTVFPKVDVDKQSDKFYEWDKEYWFRSQVERRAPGDEYPVIGMKLSTDTYFADIYHLAAAINDEELKNEDSAVRLSINKSKLLADQFLLDAEQQFADTAFKDGVWANDLTGGTDFEKWSDFAASNPLIDFDDAKDTMETETGMTPNVAVMGVKVYRRLRRHPVLTDMYKHVRGGVLTMTQLQEALEIPKIVVARAIKNTGEEGAAFAGERILGDHCLYAYVPETPALETPAAGYKFQWKLDDAGGYTVPITRWRDGKRDRVLLRGKTAYDFKIIGTDLGYFFKDCI